MRLFNLELDCGYKVVLYFKNRNQIPLRFVSVQKAVGGGRLERWENKTCILS